MIPSTRKSSRSRSWKEVQVEVLPTASPRCLRASAPKNEVASFLNCRCQPPGKSRIILPHVRHVRQLHAVQQVFIISFGPVPSYQMLISPKSNIDTLKWCFFKCISFQIWLFSVSMLDLGGVIGFCLSLFWSFVLELSCSEMRSNRLLRCVMQCFFWTCPFLVLLPHLSFTLT